MLYKYATFILLTLTFIILFPILSHRVVWGGDSNFGWQWWNKTSWWFIGAAEKATVGCAAGAANKATVGLEPEQLVKQLLVALVAEEKNKLGQSG